MLKIKLNIFVPLMLLVILQLTHVGCKPTKFDKDKYGNCSDEIENQEEEGVDCGGRCLPCADCQDGEKNAGETGIDCGGTCVSCIPACNTASATIDYTIHPSSFPSGIDDNSSVYFSYFYKSTSTLKIDFTGGHMQDVTIIFQDEFDPFIFLKLNETMVVKVITGDSFAQVRKRSQVKASYRASIGFSGYSGTFQKDQPIHLTKISATEIQVRFCNLLGSAGDNLSMNAVVD